MNNFIETANRAHIAIDEATRPLFALGFREAGIKNCEDIKSAKSNRREFVMPHSHSSLIVDYSISSDRDGSVSYGIGKVELGYNIYRGYEEHFGQVFCHDASSVRYHVTRNAKDILKQTGLFNETAMVLSRIYAYLENEGYILQETKRNAPFIFIHNDGKRVEISQKAEEPVKSSRYSFQDCLDELLGFDDENTTSPPDRSKTLVVSEFSQHSGILELSLSIPEYASLRVREQPESGQNTLKAFLTSEL